MSTPPTTATLLVHTRYRLATVPVRAHALIWVREGTKTLLAPGARHVFGPGQALWLHGGSQWDVINDPHPQRRYAATVLAFGEAALADALRVIPPTAAPACAPVALDAALTEAVSRAVAADLSPTLRQHRAVEVLLMLAERGHPLPALTAPTWRERLRRLVAQRPHADWPLAALARACAISPRVLQRHLQAEGASATEVVRQTRLETALALLQTTALPVGEVAARCGWGSHSRFTAAFTQRFGVRPSAVRDPAQQVARAG